MRDLSAPVALSRKITGDDRHRWSYVYEWTSDQGVEWALKPPLQSLCGWRRNAQTCRQLVERPAFVGFHCAGGSSVEQDSPAEPKMVARAALLVENGPGPAKSRRAAKSRHLTIATKVAGAKNLARGNQGVPGWAAPPISRAARRPPRGRLRAAPPRGSAVPPRGGAAPPTPPGAPTPLGAAHPGGTAEPRGWTTRLPPGVRHIRTCATYVVSLPR